MEDDLVNAVLVTEAEQVLGQLKQGHDMPIQQSQTELGALLQTWLIDGPDDEALLPEPLRGLSLGAHEIKHQGPTWHVLVVPPPKGMTYFRYAATTPATRVTESVRHVLLRGAICLAVALDM